MSLLNADFLSGNPASETVISDCW